MLREKKRDGSGVTTVADSSEVDGFVVGQESAAVRGRGASRQQKFNVMEVRALLRLDRGEKQRKKLEYVSEHYFLNLKLEIRSEL